MQKKPYSFVQQEDTMNQDQKYISWKIFSIEISSNETQIKGIEGLDQLVIMVKQNWFLGITQVIRNASDMVYRKIQLTW